MKVIPHLQTLCKQNWRGLADEIRMQWNSRNYAGKVALLVESENDRTLYVRFFNNRVVELRQTYGCGDVEQVVAALKRLGVKCFSILDSDFRRLCGQVGSENEIFLTDGHDHEMMCLANPTTAQNLFIKLEIPLPAESIDRIFTIIYQDLELLSYLKWYNFRQQLNYSFQKYNPAAKTEAQLRSFDSIYAEIKQASKDQRGLISQTDLDRFRQSEKRPDREELTNGHDFLSRLALVIQEEKRKVHQRSAGYRQIRAALYDSFTKECFEATRLYRDIRDWAVTAQQERLFEE